jgi:glycosyltransferase involved in cell wall biosynthesis
MKLMILEPAPNFGGGSEAVSLDLGRELAKRGHKIVLLHEIEGSMLPAYREFVVEVCQLNLPGFSLRAPLRTLGCAVRIGHLARRIGIDGIFSSHLGYVRIGALIRCLFGVPFCFHLGLPALDPPRFSRVAYRLIGAGITPSHHTRETWCLAGWPLETLFTVPNWVDTERFRPSSDRGALRRELGIPLESRCVVFVGRLRPEKGLEALIRAFPHVRSTVNDARLVIVGELSAEYRVWFDQVISTLNHEDRQAIIVKSVSSTSEKYFAAADIACVPSCWEEPFGLTLLEAMACALPVVATTVGVFPQIIGKHHHHFLVAPGDHSAIAERLAWWLTRPEAAAEFGMRLRRRVIRHYGAKHSVEMYENILKQLPLRARQPMTGPAYGCN